MQVHSDIIDATIFRSPVITIGSFDGVHLGHRKIIERLLKMSHSQQVDSVVITFDPHPRQVIYPNEHSLQLLTDRDEKIQLFRELNIDHLVLYPFDIEFSQLSPYQYIKDFIVEKFHPSSIVIGYDHKFGHNRSGDLSTLHMHSEKFNFKVEEIPKQVITDVSISSTEIRSALMGGNIQYANTLLGYDYTIRGKVIHGEKRGSLLGFPTANIEVSNNIKLIPPQGIYAIQAEHNHMLYDGMLYIGNKPTYHYSSNTFSIEAHLFNFSKDIYDEKLYIYFKKFLRNDRAFESSKELSQQLLLDKEHALNVLKTNAL